MHKTYLKERPGNSGTTLCKTFLGRGFALVQVILLL